MFDAYVTSEEPHAGVLTRKDKLCFQSDDRLPLHLAQSAAAKNTPII
ncbi:hypothetical protein ATPR_2904 [Acetobacter tropicalis NBRC 101654]|uniref:Uncharacterized protein n=1 Tax=Acetobacter tropicalis NBRC 101654 TaxID=749388 RepID=F7VHQ5_9PROT|nr:hypothetical protein ATPR_2904 [Acetobacter tropicalis NBRC 101654]